MSIETDIKQTTFRSPYHRLIVNLMYTNNWFCDGQMRILKPYGITLQQFNVLRILRGQSPSPAKITAITERMLDKMSNASRLVDKLMAKGLVLRIECPSDRRACDVTITDKGLDLLTRLDAVQHEWEDNLRVLDEADAVQLSKLLDQLRRSD